MKYQRNIYKSFNLVETNYKDGDRTRAAELSLRESLYPICLVTSLFFLWGFSYGLLDTLNKHFQETLNISQARSSGLQAAYFGAYPLASLGHAAWILRHYGYRAVYIWGLFLYGLGALLAIPAIKEHSFGGFCACIFLIGNSLGSLETAANPYIAGYFIKYVTNTRPGTSSSTSSKFLAGAQAAFAVGRFVGVILMHFYKPRWVFGVFLTKCIAFLAPSINQRGNTGMSMLYVVRFFESICFPTIVALGLRGLGHHTKRGSGFIVGGVIGGACVPPLLGVVADARGTGFAMVVPLCFFVAAWTYPICVSFVPSYRNYADAYTAAEVGLRPQETDADEEKGSKQLTERVDIEENVRAVRSILLPEASTGDGLKDGNVNVLRLKTVNEAVEQRDRVLSRTVRQILGDWAEYDFNKGQTKQDARSWWPAISAGVLVCVLVMGMSFLLFSRSSLSPFFNHVRS
ncbi:hypothetical protein AARAC_005044 [Aspergillus arachidicola]|uniref:MFS transporter n=1 Tax=Aspergillus arachidicola TaxID=656916 RepID=A0A2G7GA72_9EURO|nr:hypothetical protein AARAC_005044 [Aspergillus arachidicola]